MSEPRIWEVYWQEGLDPYECHASGWELDGPELAETEKVKVIEYSEYERLKTTLNDILIKVDGNADLHEHAPGKYEELRAVIMAALSR